MYKNHADFFVRMLVKSDVLFISQSELRSSFESLLSTTRIQFGLRSCSGKNIFMQLCIYLYVGQI